MFIEAFIADWTETVKRLKEDAELAYSLGEILSEGKPKWIQQLEWFPDSDGYYFGCTEVWEKIRDADDVPRETRANARAFMDHLITYKGYCQELSPETFLLSLSPESAGKFAVLYAAVDFKLYRNAFYSQAPEQDRQAIADYTESEDPNRAFEEGFLPYIKFFGRAVTFAAKRKRGLLVTMF